MRTSRVTALGILAASLSVPAPAYAQDKGDVGLTMGYPNAIGVIYHVSDRFAIRPEITFSTSSGKNESPLSTTEGDTVSVGVGVSGIFYLRQWDKLRTYVCPRYTYNHGENTTTSTLINPLFDDNESTITSNAHSFVGTFGAQFSVHERFSIFGEVGAAYSHQRTRSEVSGIRGSSNQFATRTGAGVIFYF
jgi:hypothetical protein